MKIGMRWSGLDLFRESLVTELVRSMISENPGRGFLRAKTNRGLSIVTSRYPHRFWRLRDASSYPDG